MKIPNVHPITTSAPAGIPILVVIAIQKILSAIPEKNQIKNRYQLIKPRDVPDSIFSLFMGGGLYLSFSLYPSSIIIIRSKFLI
jgi:hypothetical protein